MYKELDILYQLPEFPHMLAVMEEKWKIEQEKRHNFYNDINDSIKAEFINGEIIIHSPVTLKHNLISKRLLIFIELFVRKNNLGLVGIEKLMIRLTRNDYEPDICFFGKEKADTFSENQKLFPAPDFIAEIISETTENSDRGIKLKDYELHKIPEYWIIVPERKLIEQYILKDNKYQKTIVENNKTITSYAIKKLEIPVDAIFNEVICNEMLNKL